MSDVTLQSFEGTCHIVWLPYEIAVVYRAGPTPHWRYEAFYRNAWDCKIIKKALVSDGEFARGRFSFHFPLWFPALIFAVAGVASLRLGRRFTLRSAIIATAVVAGLLGMAVIL
jgi:hypothetical protein